MDSTGHSSAIPTKILLLIALVQGLALALLHQSIEQQLWPHGQAQWLFALYGVALVAPLMLLLGLSQVKATPVYTWTFCYSIVVLGLGYHTGTQVIPLAHISYELMIFLFVATLLVATFKSLMYVQHFAIGGALSYNRLFQLSWRNFLILGLSLLFTLLAWLALMLWAALFKAINIDYFQQLFEKPWFFYPFLTLANGFGVAIFREQTEVIDTITRIQQALMKFLLVILIFVSIIFLAALIFTGLEPLWQSGGSNLILWMQALILFFVNSVYQDDPKIRPYSKWIHRFIYFGLALLPIYSAISFYGLSLRVDQYGWSISRSWAFLLWAIFALFSVGYLWGILRLRDNWLTLLSWVNVRMGLVVLGLMLIVNSPLLDFRKISVNSQLQRLEDGVVSLEDFDFIYFRQSLAGPGYDALQTIKSEVAVKNPAIALTIDGLYANPFGKNIASDISQLQQMVKGVDDETPSDLKDAIYQNLNASARTMRGAKSYHLIDLDLNSDGKPEYILIEARAVGVGVAMYYLDRGQWKNRWMNYILDNKGTGVGVPKDLLDAIEANDFEAVDGQWQDLQIGDHKFHLR